MDIVLKDPQLFYIQMRSILYANLVSLMIGLVVVTRHRLLVDQDRERQLRHVGLHCCILVKMNTF